MKIKEENNDFLWRQFERLGEMMGDGLHNEPDGKWISRDYKKLSKILFPDTKEEIIIRNVLINEQMKDLLSKKICSCGGNLKQSRSGSKVAFCLNCNMRYKAKSKKL